MSGYMNATAAGGSIGVRPFTPVDEWLHGGLKLFHVFGTGGVEEAEPHEQSAPRAARTADTRLVLVVDDEPGVRGLARQILEFLGYQVLTASGGPEAIAMFESVGRSVDLLLTDLMMPGMNGRVLFESLAERDAGLKVLYMSGYTDGILGENGILERGTRFIAKPFTIPDLAERVRQAIEPG